MSELSLKAKRERGKRIHAPEIYTDFVRKRDREKVTEKNGKIATKHFKREAKGKTLSIASPRRTTVPSILPIALSLANLISLRLREQD